MEGEQVRDLAADFPGWHVWAGVTGVLYARRLKSSPPVVLRDATVPGLRARVRAYLNGEQTAPGG